MSLTALTKPRARWATFKLKTAQAVSRILYERLIENGVSVKDFGAVGDGVTDDTSAVIAALTFSKYVLVPEGEFLVTGINITNDNTKLEFLAGASFKMNSNNKAAYQCLAVISATNVEIIRPTLTGDRLTNSATGEWGHGLGIFGGTNVTIEDPTVTDMFGDGIYVGRNYSLDGTTFVTVPEATNTKIKFKGTVTAHNNRRNNVSLITFDGLSTDVLNLTKDITGVAPDAGLDIEPNTVDEPLKNLSIVSLNTKGHQGSGTTIGLRNSNGTTPDISIDIKSITSDGDRDFFCSTDAELKGTLNIDNLYVTNAKLGGLQLEKLDNLGSLSVTFGKVTVVDCNTSLDASVRLGSAVACWRNTSAVTFPLGGFTIGHLYIDSPDSTTGVYFADASGAATKETPIHIKRIERIIVSGERIIARGVIHVDEDPFEYLAKVLIPAESSTLVMSLSQYTTLVKTHEDKSSAITLPLISDSMYGYRVKILMLDATAGLSRITTSGADVMKITSTVANQIDTTMRGASIAFRASSTGWEVTELSGVWV